MSWPFECFCDQLISDLFSSSWETRHGGSTGLRELIRIHGAGVGRKKDHTKQQVEEILYYNLFYKK